MATRNGARLFGRDDTYVTSPFGLRPDPFGSGKMVGHDGVDYGTYGGPWPQYAIADGVIDRAGTDGSGGKYVFIKYPDLGYVAVHYHLAAISVSAGQQVRKGTVLGITGTTGRSTGVHLHYGWVPLDRYTYWWDGNPWEDFEAHVFADALPALPAIPAGAAYAIDVSDAQGEIDFDSLDKAGVAKALLIRTGYGDQPEQEDKQFRRNIEAAIQRGYRIGIYHFSYAANPAEAASEAASCARLLEPYRPHITLGVYFDMEGDTERYLWEYMGITVDAQLVADNTDAFCKTIAAAGYKAGVYYNLDWWQRFYVAYLPSRPELLRWFARWGIDAPDLPCDIWQYAVDPGTEYGFPGRIDKDVIYMSDSLPINGQRLYITGPRAASCEFFESQNNAVALGKLPAGADYELVYIAPTKMSYQLGEETVSGPWVQFRGKDGNLYWASALNDRAVIRTPTPITPPAPPTPETPPAPPVTPPTIPLGASLETVDKELVELREAVEQAVAQIGQADQQIKNLSAQRDAALAMATNYKNALQVVLNTAAKALEVL